MLAATLLCVLVVAAGAWVLVQERRSALRLASIDVTHLARQVSSEAATLALLGDKAAVDANRAAYVNGDDALAIGVDLDMQANLLPGMHSGAVFGPRGERLAASSRFPHLPAAWHQEILERHVEGWEDMIISSAEQIGLPDTIAVSRARWDAGQAFEGFAVSLVDLSRLREWAAEQARTSRMTIVLMLADGTIIAPLGNGGPTAPSDAAGLHRLLSDGPGPGMATEGSRAGIGGNAADSVVGIGLARDFPFIGLVEMARSDVLADWRRLRDMIAAGCALTILAVGLALGVFIRGERRRAQTEQDIRVSEERLAAALENGNLSLWDWDIAHDRIVFGHRLPGMLGCAEGELVQSAEEFLALMHPDDKPAVLAAFQAHVEDAAGTDVFAAEYRLRRKDGGWTWIADRGRAVERDASGRALRVIGVHADITRRKTAEQALEDKSRALQASNRDLEQFAYIASHDLQEPLRMVSSYLSLMLRREGDRLTDTGRDYADTAADGAKRMGQLIRDLLEYSRVGTQGGDLTPQDMAGVLAEVTKNLGIAIAESGGSVTVEPDAPPVLGDRTQLVRLVQNLICNALKYRAPDRPPVIHVGWTTEGTEEEGVVTLSVRDNGIGIEARDYDRIFQIFQRLHGRDEYEGTGIGLAVCRRIVERHGGRLWVESRPGEGTTFHASLPRAAAVAGEAGAAHEPVRAMAF